MALLQKWFSKKAPDGHKGFIEISQRLYVFGCCVTTDAWEQDEYKSYMGNTIGQLMKHYPGNPSVLMFNFREKNTSQISSFLSDFDVPIIDYEPQYEGCPLLPMEIIHQILRSSESWLSLGKENILLMHCERGGWPVLAYMLAAFLIYRKYYTEEYNTLDMIYKKAPRELLHFFSPLNPLPSQIRYLQYVSRREVGAEWPPLGKALTLDCVIIRKIPDFDGKGGCCPIIKIYGQDPSTSNDKTPKLLYSNPKKSKNVRHFVQEEHKLLKIDINCHVLGDVVLECINLHDDMTREKMMFRSMFNTAFISSNLLMLNRDEIDILWDATDLFPKDFRVELLFSDTEAATSKIPEDLVGFDVVDLAHPRSPLLKESMATQLQPLSKISLVPPLSLPPLSNFSLASPPSPLQPLSKISSGPQSQPSPSPPLSPSSKISSRPPSPPLQLLSKISSCPPQALPPLSNISSVLPPSPLQPSSKISSGLQSPTPLSPSSNISSRPSSPLLQPSLQISSGLPPLLDISLVSPLTTSSNVSSDTPSTSPTLQPLSNISSSQLLTLPPLSNILLVSQPSLLLPPLEPSSNISSDPPPSILSLSQQPLSKISSGPAVVLPPLSKISSVPPLALPPLSKISSFSPPPPLQLSDPLSLIVSLSLLLSPSLLISPSSKISSGPPPPPVPQSSKISSGPPPPPPPIISHNGNAPPPPPPIISRNGNANTGPTLPPPKTGNVAGASKNQLVIKLTPFYWSKLSRVSPGSMWAETQESGEDANAPEIDISELKSLFSLSNPTEEQSVNKSEIIRLIDLKKAYNCEILLTKIKIPSNEFMDYILALKNAALLEADQVDNLLKNWPDEKEMVKLKGYKEDIYKLGKCEQFFLELLKVVPRPKSKLEVFSFKLRFTNQVSDLREKLNIINSAVEQIRSSRKLKRVMQTILSLGNAMNQGTARGSAVGFKLDSLLKLTTTQTKDKGMTLMKYLCKVLADKLPEVLDFSDDLESLELASKIEKKYTADEKKAISDGLAKVAQELLDSANDGPVYEYFHKALKEFHSFAEGEVTSLTSLYFDVDNKIDALFVYFSEDKTRCPYEEVVSTLLEFVRKFNQTIEENAKPSQGRKRRKGSFKRKFKKNKSHIKSE